MDEEWPKGWYRDDQGDAEAATRMSAAPPPAAGRPTAGRPGDAKWYGTDLPPGGGGPMGPGGPRGPRVVRSGWRRWLRPKWILIGFAALVLVIVLTGVGLYFNFNGKLNRAAVLVPTSVTSAGTNWLITGSDGRGGLTAAQDNALALGRNITGARSDTIMLLHMPANGTRPTLISIPRDSYVNIPGYGYNKINAAYAYGGPKLLIQTVQDATGLRIDHYMGIGFSGLVSVVDDVGGVDMCLKAPMVDPKAGLNLKAGCQTLNGKQALAFVRTRAFGNGDLQRIQDQRELLKSLLSKMTSTGTMINPFSSIPAASGVTSSLTVDSGTQLYQLLSVGFALRDPVTTTIPLGGFATESVGSVVLWDPHRAHQMFTDLAHDTALPKSLVSGSSVTGTT